MNTKKILALFLALAMVFTLAACKKDSADNNADNSGSENNTDGQPAYSQGLDENGFFEGVTAKDYVTLGQYKGLKVPADQVAVTPAEVQAEIDNMMSSYSESAEVTGRPAALGDVVNIDFEGYMDGEKFDGGTGNNPSLELGSGAFIAGFEDGIVGHNVGDQFDLELSFPDPYPNNPDLAGKPVTFKVTLNSISEKVAAQLTDAFVAENFQENYGWSTVADMKAGVEENLKDNALYDYVYTQIDDFQVSDVPDSMVQYQSRSMLAYYEQMATMYGMTLDDFISAMGMSSKDDVIEQNREQLTASARTYLIYQAIAEDAGISVNQEDLDEEFSDMSEEDYKNLLDFYGLNYIKLVLLNQKVSDLIMDSAVIE